MTRPSSDRDGECICDYNPETTDGPQEDCPFHGRSYAYWIERGDALAARLEAAEAAVERVGAALSDQVEVALPIARWLVNADKGAGQYARVNPDALLALIDEATAVRAALAGADDVGGVS